MNYWLISCLVQCAGERFFSTTQSFYKLFNISHFMMAHQTNKSSNSKLGRAWCAYSWPTPKCDATTLVPLATVPIKCTMISNP